MSCQSKKMIKFPSRPPSRSWRDLWDSYQSCSITAVRRFGAPPDGAAPPSAADDASSAGALGVDGGVGGGEGFGVEGGFGAGLSGFGGGPAGSGGLRQGGALVNLSLLPFFFG